jgi:opacity protein-like surface antigen
MKTQIISGSLGLLLAGAVSAEERPMGPYFGADFGVALTQDTKLREFPGASGGGKVEFDPGVRLSLSGGWRVTPWFRGGGEFGFISHTIDGADAAVTHMPLLANVEFQLPNRTRLLPFIGGGPGVAFSVLDIDDDFLGDGDFVDGSTSDAVFAWQVYAGLRFRINESMSVGVVYKYFEADGSDWDVENSSSEISFGRIRSHAINASFSMSF